MSKFKVGDKVRVRKDLKSNEWYGRVTFTLKMKKYFEGIETTIEDVDCDGCYFLTGCEDYIFTDEMLEPVEEIKKGDLVEITNGILKGTRGKIVDITRSHINIMIDNSTYITIKKDCVKLVEKAKEEGTCHIASFGEKCKYILDGDKTTIVLPSGVRGQVKLYKDDEYDKTLGMSLAYHKAKFKEIVKEINKKK